MEKIAFMLDSGETEEFYVLEQTKLGGNQYILVTDAAEGDGDAWILKETSVADKDEAGSKESGSRKNSAGKDGEMIYMIVEDDTELSAVAAVFENLLEDIELS